MRPATDDSALQSVTVWDDWYAGRRVLITGGLGFLGSNLAHRLVGLGAHVRVVDAEVPGSGANPYNLNDIWNSIDFWRADLRDPDIIPAMLTDQDVLFNLAAQAGHLASMQNPEDDFSINATCQLAIVESCRRFRPKIKVVYTATRQMYRRSSNLPISETHPIDPIDYNGVSKRAGELFHLVAHRAYGLRACSLRLTNTYGPRMRYRDGHLMFLGDWIRRLILGEPIPVYGAGQQIRDFNYVEDVVNALLAAGASPDADGHAFNLGGDEPVSLADLAQMLTRLYGAGEVVRVPYPQDRKRIEFGDYQGDYSHIRRTLGWSPTVTLRDGLQRTVDYYAQHHTAYA